MKICAVIIAHNNEPIIGDLILRCRRILEPDVFVLDQNSTDRTLAESKEAGAMILFPDANDNKPTLMASLHDAYQLGYTHAVVLRASDPPPPEIIPRLLDRAWQAPGRIWLGVSDRRHRKMTAAGFWTGLTALKPLRHTSAPARIYPLEEILHLPCRETGQHFDAEILMRASWAGIQTSHVEIAAAPPLLSNRSGFGKFAARMFVRMLIRSPRILWKRLSSA